MPAFIITSPDGRKFKITAPAGTTQEEALAHFQSQKQPVQEPAPKAITSKLSPYSFGNLAGAAVEPSMTLGAGAVMAPVAGLAGLLGTILPGPEGQGTDWTRKVLDKIYTPKTTGGETALGAIGFPFEKLAQGANWVGEGIAGLQMPKDSERLPGQEIPDPALVGAGVNTALQVGPMLAGAKYLPNIPKVKIPGLLNPVELTKNIFGPVEGRAGRLLRNVAGEKAEAVANALQTHRNQIPGSQAIAGQAAVPAGSAEFSALQEIIANRAPSTYGTAGIRGAQETARQTAIGTIAKTPAELEAAKTLRRARADINYGRAYENLVKTNDTFAAIAKNPYFKEVMGDATKLAKARGVNLKTNLTELLQYVKEKLDAKLGIKGDAAFKATERATVEKLKQDLVDWMGKENPDYEIARAQFAEDSAPINRMKTGKALEDALTNSLGTTERPTVFTNAVKKISEEQSIATGKPRMADLTAEERTIVDTVKAELARDAEYTKMAREGAQESARRIGVTLPQAPAMGAFSPAISVTRALYNRLLGRAEEKLLHYLAQQSHDPAKIAQIMKATLPRLKSSVDEQLLRMGTYPGAVQGLLTQPNQPEPNQQGLMR